jgi:hypothetical protein
MFATKYLIIAAAAGGFLAGSAAGGFGTKMVYDNIVIPAMEQAAEDARIEAVNAASARCEEQITAATTVAAERAKNAERIRLQAIHDAALEVYRNALRESEEELAAARQEQEERDRQHELQLAESGRSCPLDRGDIDYLNGVRDASPD